MYQEEVANLTAEHLRTHIGAYLDYLQNTIYPDAINLQGPKSVETDNLVGGVYNATPNEMPAYAVDIVSKAFDGVDADALWIYSYDGHIAGVVSGASEVTVNQLVKRHEQAVERFVREHEFMHVIQSQLGNDFSIREFGFSGAAFSGAELVTERNERQVWIAGFRVDTVWKVSESGPGQHG